MTVADGGVTAFAYDAVGNLLSITDPLGNPKTYLYNQANDLVKVTNALGIPTTFSYDASGRQTSRTNVDGTTWETTYNALGYVASLVSPLGNSIEYAYDLNGNLVEVIDQSGAATQYSYDALDRLSGVTDALGGKAAYVYDAASRMISVKDPRDQVTTYTYDAVGRLLSQTDPLGNTLSYSYDAAGRLTALTNPLGQTVNNTYDALNRLLSSSGPGVNVQYSHDAAGNRTQMIDSTGTTVYSYDDMDRPLSVDSPRGLVSYTYDLAGRRVSMTQPGMTLNYSYNALHNLVGINQGSDLLVQYAYDALGRNSIQTFGNGVQTTRSYDLDSRLVSLETTAGSTLLQSIAYTLDGRGNITAENGTNFSAAYNYDALNRLTGAILTHAPVDVDPPPSPTDNAIFLPLIVRASSAASSTLSQNQPLEANAIYAASSDQTNTYAFTYDPAGNRLSVTKNGSTQTYTYDAANQITNPGFVYDQAGRLINDGVSSYNYDALNRLISYGTTQFTYDGDGNRVGMNDGGVEIDYLLDTAPALPYRIASSSNGSIDRYVFGAGLVAQNPSGGDVDYFHADALNSLRLLTNAAGEIVEAPFYASFGLQLDGDTPFGFAGEPLDGELVHLRARDYHPGLGRFLTPDPMGQVLTRTQGLNLHSYVENNPVNFSDPSGLFLDQATNAIVGAVDWTAKTTYAAGSAVVGGAQAFGSWIHARIFGESSSAGSGGATNGQYGGPSAGSLNSSSGVIAAGGYNFTQKGSGRVIGAGGGNVIAAGGGNVIAAGGGNVIGAGGGNVIAAGGGNVIAAGGGNVIAAGGGNISPVDLHLYGAAAVIAAGGGNVIAAGGANVIAAGGGNVIAAGGANVIAAGGGNLSPAAYLANYTARVIAAGGGNVIAAGGGNVIAAGGGN
jgi:RHS repeat-associated protein